MRVPCCPTGRQRSLTPNAWQRNCAVQATNHPQTRALGSSTSRAALWNAWSVIEIVRRRKALQHLAYELEALVAAAVAVPDVTVERLEAGLAKGAVVAPLAEDHALLEGALVHTR